MDMERKFFAFVRVFALAAAALSLVIAMGMAGFGLIRMNASGGGEVSAPTVRFEDYKNDSQNKQIAAETAAKQAEEALRQKKSANKKDPSAVPDQFADLLDRIEKSVLAYAERTGQATPTDTFRAAVYRHSMVFAQQGFQEAFLKQLAGECAAMERSAEAVAKLPPQDPTRLFWANFLTYYFNSYESNLLTQERTKNKTESEAAHKRSNAGWYFYAAAGVFVSFITLVMLLVLFSIESNTYFTRKALEKTESQKSG